MLFQVEGSACSKVLGWKGQGWLEEPKEGFAGGSVVKNPPANTGDMGLILGRGDTLGKKMATHSNILAWEIPWTEEPGGL